MAKSKVVYIDSNYVKEIYHKYINVYDDINNEKNASTIILNGEMKSIYDKQKGDFNKGQAEKEVLKLIKNIRNKISQTMYALKTLDDSIDIRGYQEAKDSESNTYQNALADIMGRTKKMTLFQMQRYARLNGGKSYQKNGKWYIKIGNYTYNYTDNLLIDNNNKKSIKVKYYLPSNYSDLSKTNTVTTFTSNKIDQSNCILICPSWNGKGKNPMIASSTKFMNKLVKTNKKSAENIIMGGSKYGSQSLQIAANNGNLYDTVVCINASLIVNGKNANSLEKVQFNNINALKKLNGKKIYFVIANGEPNMYKHEKNGNIWASGSVTQSYLYTGIKLAAKYCPNSEVHLITNSDNTVFNNIKNNNFHYSSNSWTELGIGKDYYGHGYQNIIKDLLKSNLFD